MDVGGHILPHVTRPIKMDPRIGSLWLFATCLGIVMVSCYISGVACDVPDDVVYTDLHKTVRIGDRVVLKCQFRGTPLAVYWKKGDDPERSPTLVSWITGDPATGVCVGERSCQIMEMNAEFSLIIKEVSIAEQGPYVCRVANYKGILIHNFTDISVFSPPKEPYPIINECQMISSTHTETSCIISTSTSVEISCSASGYFPDINLYFLHGSTRLYTKDPIEVTNLDRTKNKTLSAITTASENRYICFASVPGSQEQRTTTVLVTGPTILIDKSDRSVATYVVPVTFIAVIGFSIIMLRQKKQQRGQDTYAKVRYHLPMGKIYDFLASTDNAVSDDDLEHICWHVHSCRETVQPIVDSLQYSYTNSTKPADNCHISAPPRCDEIWDDLQIMKRWKAMSAATMYGDEDEHQDETVTFRTKSGEMGFKSKHTESMPSNQMIQLCRALKKAGRTTGDRDGQVYHQLSKTFYKIREEFKSELTDKVLQEFALNITKRHCQRLGDTFRLSARTIANRNEEDLEMFRTDMMLKAWVQDQKCSNYEIRRRLRQAAEQCNRQDIADIFISKEQSEVMTLTIKLQACVTVTNEEQSPGASRSENVSSVSHDELDRIGRYAGSAILLALCKKYDVTKFPEQQSQEGKELPFETKVINVLKSKLDSEHERNKREKKPNTPRETLRQLLHNEHPRYACLLAMKKTFSICDVELIDLAFRLIMADVYPFAKALNISDTVLNSYRCNISPSDLTQGTANIMKQVNTKRGKMVKLLRQAGYSEEARALYFGFEISIGDMIEVGNQVDMAQLAKQLGVSDDVQSTSPGNQGKDGTLHQSGLLKWRKTVCSSTFNHRLVLADALFSMGEEQLALNIISGKYRNGVMNNQVAELLGATISNRELPTYRKFLHHNGSKLKSPTEWSNGLLGAGFYAHAHEFMAGGCEENMKVGTETGNMATEKLHQGSIAINEPEVMQEKSRDGAAESKENTTENLDTKEQGDTPEGSDECKQDESSKLLI